MRQLEYPRVAKRRHGRVQRAVLGLLVARRDAHAGTGRAVTRSTWQLAWRVYDCDSTTPPTESQVRSVRRALLGLQRDGTVIRVSHSRYAAARVAAL